MSDSLHYSAHFRHVDISRFCGIGYHNSLPKTRRGVSSTTQWHLLLFKRWRSFFLLCIVTGKYQKEQKTSEWRFILLQRLLHSGRRESVFTVFFENSRGTFTAGVCQIDVSVFCYLQNRRMWVSATGGINNTVCNTEVVPTQHLLKWKELRETSQPKMISI